jgi:hypothetical protein
VLVLMSKAESDVHGQRGVLFLIPLQ